MIFTETRLKGAFIIDLDRRRTSEASSRAPSARTNSGPMG